jgi:hypothetical protein
VKGCEGGPVVLDLVKYREQLIAVGHRGDVDGGVRMRAVAGGTRGHDRIVTPTVAGEADLDVHMPGAAGLRGLPAVGTANKGIASGSPALGRDDTAPAHWENGLHRLDERHRELEAENQLTLEAEIAPDHGEHDRF